MGRLSTASLSFPAPTGRLAGFGFKFSTGGAHCSRTMMLEEITGLLRSVPPETSDEGYRAAVVVQNVLGKGTESNRRKALRHLRELYGMSPNVPLFLAYRELGEFDPQSVPLLSLMVAWTRDPILRSTTRPVLDAAAGAVVTRDAIQASVAAAFPSHYTDANVAKIARYAASTWTQSGHLHGHSRKVRVHVQPRPASLTLSLLLGFVSDAHGDALFATPWVQLLDLGPAQAKDLALQAHREELLTVRAAGSVIDVTFPRFSRLLESAA
jgi:hypothetical protein